MKTTSKKTVSKDRPLKTQRRKFFMVGFILIFALMGSYYLLSSHAATPPVLGIYRGAALSTSMNTGGNGINQVSAWLGRDVQLGEDFNSDATWTDVEGQSWQLNPWGQWVNAKAGRNLTFAVSPFPKTGGSLAECASGAYNSHWLKLGQNLVSYKLSNTYIRFGHEMNGTYYAWSATGGNEQNYINCFHQFVTTIRSVSGQNLKFVWNPNGGGYSSVDLSTMYPGDSYVDFIGPDAYDQSWATNTYPYPSPCDASCVATHQQNAWNAVLSSQYGGLTWFSNFAKTHGKPLVIPEWGNINRPDGHGGLDNAYYVQQMANFINDPNNNVGWHVYFDYTSQDGALQISPVPATFVTTIPNAQAKFKALFSAATTTTTPGDSTPPSTAFVTPLTGSTVSASIKPEVTASDAVGVSRVDFYLDGVLAQSEAAAPYCFKGDTAGVCNPWDTKTVANGLHTILAKAYDAAGNVGQATTTIAVNNAVISTPTPTDTTPPTVTIKSPANGAHVSRKVSITASSTDNVGVASMQILIDNIVYANASSSSIGYTWNLNSKSVINGAHTITVTAKDQAGNITSKSETIYK